jgi:hypothetical protein
VRYVESQMRGYHALLVAWGGCVAEQLATGGSGDSGRRQDEVLARQASERIGYRDPMRAVPEVVEILVEHWGAVEAVAQALLEREDLTGDEVHRLFDTARKALPPRQHYEKLMRIPRAKPKGRQR